MKLSELFLESVQTINNVNYDSVNGIGAVGNNANIDYLGIKVLMKPSKFLRLALPLEASEKRSLEFLKTSLKDGKPIGPPFLEIDLKDDENGNPTPVGAKVKGHEGRNRAYAIFELYGDEPILVHLFFLGLRARHITPEIIEGINKKMVNQEGIPLLGPFFVKFL